MNHVLKVTFNDHIRICSVTPMAMDYTATGADVIVGMLKKYAERDDDLTPMECIHFNSWGFSFMKLSKKIQKKFPHVKVEFGTWAIRR